MMEYSQLLKSIELMSPEAQCQLLMDMGRICEPNAEKIGASLADAPNIVEPLHRFITKMHISYDRQYNACKDVDFLDESVPGVIIGISFKSGIICAWSTEGCKMTGTNMDAIEKEYMKANDFRKVKVA